MKWPVKNFWCLFLKPKILLETGECAEAIEERKYFWGKFWDCLGLRVTTGSNCRYSKESCWGGGNVLKLDYGDG